MVHIHIDQFLRHYQAHIGRLNEEKASGLTYLLTRLMESERIDTVPKAAYILATIKWETAATFQPIAEYGTMEYLRSKPYYPYYGRGYSMLTWYRNYVKFGKALQVPLAARPELALERGIAWAILELGMTDDYEIVENNAELDPNFTSDTLEKYFTDEKTDFYNARRIVNPADKRSYQPIAETARRFQEVILSSVIAEADFGSLVRR